MHGDEGVAAAIKTTEVLFGSEPFTDLPAAIVREAFTDAPSVEVPRRLISDGLPVHKFLVEAQACASQSEAKRLVSQGAVRLNNVVVSDAERPMGDADVTADAIVVIRLGKKRYNLATLM